MVSIILLAAGSSFRMGQSKQLLKIGEETLLARSANEALQSTAYSVTVVLGANEKEHRGAIDHLPLTIVQNPNWQKGMGSSLRTGLVCLLKQHPSIQAVIIMVCDQPLLRFSHLKKIIDTYVETKSPIVASLYAGTAGVPALFDKSLFPQLLSLPDDQGARKIIQQQKKYVVTIDFPEGAIDLDTPEDLRKYTES